ncbi:hypothetical protein LSH36_16g03058 [Paralvinella palmiformis]|uniref:Protein CMSS1 n=1 Tax=Paralvinella palmiformis TaxID=53620 RepID=A0AAD9KCC1_9ANNE|nr:hypothetical protein LSH36_16g03058 [Paralvinella palmiformis]
MKTSLLLQDDGHLDQPEVCLLKGAYYFSHLPVEARATGYDVVMISTVSLYTSNIMADDLDDEWWTEKSDGNKHDEAEEEDSEEDTVINNSGSKRKLDSVQAIKDDKPQKKKRSKGKKISDILAKTEQEPIKYTDLIMAINKHYGGQLSAVERDDMSLSECHFASCSSVSDTVSSYLHTVLTVSKWKKRIKAMEQSPGSPRLLIICSAGSRAVNLIRDLRSFCSEECRVAKLFAKHIKLEEQTKFLKKTVIQAGVGTPNRIASLLDNESLSLCQTNFVLLDWSWRDAKLRRLVDIPQIRDDLYKLLQNYLVPRVKSGAAKFYLF